MEKKFRFSNCTFSGCVMKDQMYLAHTLLSYVKRTHSIDTQCSTYIFNPPML